MYNLLYAIHYHESLSSKTRSMACGQAGSLQSLELCQESSMVSHNSWDVLAKRGQVYYRNNMS